MTQQAESIKTNALAQDIGFFVDLDTYYAANEGAIDKILEKLPKRDRWCVEFGASDGIDSTARKLILEHGYSGILIEGQKWRYKELKKNYQSYPNVVTLNRFVGFEVKDGLDSILAGTPIPHDFDFLTVDIDGNDYHVWNAVTQYRPKVVMIEFNSTIPPEVEFVQPADPSVSQGSSLAALVDLGKKKGYELIGVVGINAFFVVKELYPVFGLADNAITTLWTNRDCVTYIFSGYDGKIFVRGCCKLPWHGVPMRESQLQVLAAPARGYPFTAKRRLIYGLLNPLQIGNVLKGIKEVVYARLVPESKPEVKTSAKK
jgi:hypothetical protein